MTRLISIGDLTVLTSATAKPADGVARAPILFVHGYCATALMWECYVDHFSRLGYPCYAVNLRGRAGSRPVANLGAVRVADFIDDAREVALTLGKPVIMGHSMGGLVALKLAEEGVVSAAVAISPAPPRGIPVLSWRLITHMAPYVPAIFRSRPLVPRFEDFRDLVLNCVPTAEQRDFFAHFVPDSGRAARDMMFGAVRVDGERLTGIPVLVVGADEDHFLPMRIALRVAKRYNTPFRTAHGHGHASIHEPGWEELASYIQKWLEADTRPGITRE